MKYDVLKSLKEKRSESTSKKDAGLIFNPFFETITDAAFSWIEKEEGVVDVLEGPLAEVLNRNILLELLIKVSKRVLIEDLNIRREMGALAGDTEEAQYEDYVWNHLMDPAYVDALFQEYPVWKETLLQVTEYFIRNIKELIQHLCADRNDLNAEFFSTDIFDKIRRITGSGSDTHCENRIVYCVELDNGKRLYHKPRVNTGVRFFNELYTKLCASLDIASYINPVYMNTDYVWEKEAVYAECENEAQVYNYFVRLGIILAICHVCHGGDMHYENMIASGEFPIIIDFETLVQLPPKQAETAEKTANHIIGESVLPIGILPFYGARHQNFNADFSGLCGGGKQIMDIRIPAIRNPGKSTMCIDYKYGETGDKYNRVRLNGAYVQPQDYADAFYKGYSASYTYIMEHQEEILELSSLMEGAKFRQLLRNTQEYQMILDLSYHPEFMREDGKRRAFLEEALTTPLFENRQAVLNQEIDEMLKGDVPYFQFDMSSVDVLNLNGKPLEPFAEKPGMEFLRERILSRSEEDLKLQKRFMEISLNYNQVEHLEALYHEEIQAVDVDKVCKQIGDRICDHHLTVDGRVLWMNTIIMATGVDKRHTYFMELSDRYLYQGTMGMAVFMAAFLKRYPNHKIREVFEAIVADTFAYTDALEKTHLEEPVTGVFLGEASIVYGYQLMYVLTKEARFLEYAKKHCHFMVKYVEKDELHDLIGGNAGAILAFLNMYDLDPDDIYLMYAKQAADHLLAHAVETETGIGWKNSSSEGMLGGFAHGCAGIMYALARLTAYVDNQAYLDAAYKAFTYERTMNVPECGGWRDYRCEEPYYMSDFKWCHGIGGIMLGWSLACEYFDDERKAEIQHEISEVTALYPDMLLKEELGLCHGNFGNLFIGQLSGVRAWEKSMEENRAQSMSVLHRVLSEMEGNAILHEHYDYSLMTGWAGIGYSLLHAMSDEIPGILDVRVMDV